MENKKMQFKNLPAKNSKDEANIVEILNRKLNPENEAGDKFKIPAEHFVYPQADNLEEAKTLCGGEDELLRVFNDHLRDSAVTDAKNSIRMASSGTHEQIVKAGIEKGKNYTFVEVAKISASEAKEKFSELRAIASSQNLSEEEMLAAVRRILLA